MKRLIIFTLMSLLLTVVLLPAGNSAEAKLEFKRISEKTVAAGNELSWSISFEGRPGYFLTHISLYILGPNGEKFDSYWSYSDNGLRQEAKLSDEIISIQTDKNIFSGAYSIKGLSIGTYCRSCESGKGVSYDYLYTLDPILLKILGNSGTSLTDLSFADFQIEGGEFTKSPVPKIEKISLNKSKVSPGETIRVSIDILTPAYVWKWGFELTSPTGRKYSWSGFNDSALWSNQTQAEYKRSNEVSSISFDILIDEDFSPGSYKVSRFTAQWFLNGPPQFLNNTRNTSAFWGGSYDLLNDRQGLRINDSWWSSLHTKYEIDKLQLTVLDAGQGNPSNPIWTRIEWLNTDAKAGEVTFLEIDVDGMRSQISSICVGNFVNITSGQMINDYYCESQLLGTSQQYRDSTWVRKGTFQIPIYFPRETKPGVYTISYVSLESSKCSSAQDVNCNNSQNSISRVTFSGNGLIDESLPWVGIVYPNSKSIRISGVADIAPPMLSFSRIESDRFEFTAKKPYEISCEYQSNFGRIQKPIDEKSIQVYQVLDLTPDKEVKIDYTCKSYDGATKVGSYTVKTLKPTPPTIPNVTISEIGVETAKFNFVYREGFKYQVKTNSGYVVISNGAIEFSGLSPDSKIEFQISITDPYLQTATSDPIVFTTNGPKAAAEIKAKQEIEAAVAKALAELKAKQEAEAKAKAAALKRTSINCVKGKLTKKVTAVKPKCPTGYKVKK
jgi:hypothetical protein